MAEESYISLCMQLCNSKRFASRRTIPLARVLQVYTTRDFVGFLLGAAVAVSCVLLFLPPSSWRCGGGAPAGNEALAQVGNGTQRDPPPSMKKLDMGATSVPEEDKLAEVLARSTMEEDKTVIMTFTNEAWAAPGSLMDLFLESFRTGVNTEPLLRHLVIVAVDAKSFERCRNRFQARVLELGYSFDSTDVDIVWLRNPLLRIPVGADLAMSCDVFYGDNLYDLSKKPNGGFLYVKSRARTRAFYADWYEARAAYPDKHEQYVFDRVKLTETDDRLLQRAKEVESRFIVPSGDEYEFSMLRDRRLSSKDMFHLIQRLT